MGKIRRNNIFETNSSSTHCINIEKIIRNNEELLIGEMLYPERLSGHFSYEDDAMWVCTAKTYAEKLALVAHWVKCVDLDNDCSGFLLNKFQDIFNIKISDEFTENEFYPYNDCGTEILSYDTFDSDMKYLIDIINDPVMQITELTKDY